MTPEEIIEMAEQCGIDPHDMCEDPRIAINNLERFAKLVAAKEREACASVCFQEGPSIDGELIAEAIRARGEA